MRLSLLLALALLAGCSEGATVKPPPFSASTSGQSGSGSSGGSGGAGGGSSSSGGAGGAGGAGAGVPVDAGASDPPCTNDFAYWAVGMSFGAPTPQDLGLALSELAYDQSSHPISIILAAKGGVAAATMGVSATADNGAGSQIFPAGTKPTFVPALLSFGGFQSDGSQASGVLHLVDQAGPVDIELNNITVKATTSAGCANMVATLSAVIPGSEGDKTLHLKAGNSTIAELGGGNVGGPKDAGEVTWEVRAYFAGETMSFDFSTLK